MDKPVVHTAPNFDNKCPVVSDFTISNNADKTSTKAFNYFTARSRPTSNNIDTETPPLEHAAKYRSNIRKKFLR
jgi:hypothetical protein